MTRTARHLILLGACATAPIALGIAMHLEHVAAEAACAAQLAGWSVPEAEPGLQVLAVPTPIVVLPSVVAPPEPPRAEPGARELAFVIDIDGPHVVLATEIDEAWATGGPRYRDAVHNIYEVGEVWRRVDAERLPTADQAAIGRTLDVYSETGRVCVARIGAPVLVGELSGTIDYADEDALRVAADGTKTVDARAAWKQSRKLLVAPLLGGDCAGAVWARDAALPQPLVYAPQDPSDAPSTLALRLLQRAPATRKLAAAFAKHVAHVREDGKSPPRLAALFEGRRWLEPTRGDELDVFTTEGEEFGVCGGFDYAWGAVRLDAAGTRAEAWLEPETDSVRAVVDLDGDGDVEVIAESYLGPTRVFSLKRDALDGIQEIAMLPELPFHGCPC